jgi:hypothetical protein
MNWARLICILSLAACTGTPPAEPLTLSGAPEVRVDSFGPVDGPDALQGGAAAQGVVWTVDAPTVAKVGADGTVEALSSGKAVITGTVGAQQVSWTLLVDPPVVLAFVEPPSSVAVGKPVQLKVAGKLGDADADPGTIAWTTNDPSHATISASGELTGVAVGVVWVTASSIRSEATVEISVTEPAP